MRRGGGGANGAAHGHGPTTAGGGFDPASADGGKYRQLMDAYKDSLGAVGGGGTPTLPPPPTPYTRATDAHHTPTTVNTACHKQ